MVWLSFLIFLSRASSFPILPMASNPTMTEETDHADALYDFDGEYGRKYLSFIRKMIPAYDDVLDLIGDIVSAQEATRILVIGPGHGEELLKMSTVLPKVKITAYEASDAMTRSSRKRIDQAGHAHRVTIISEPFGEDTTCPAEGNDSRYDVVTLLNVLHLMPREKQLPLLRAAAKQVAPNGLLLVSGISSVSNDLDKDNLFHRIADKRWDRLDIPKEEREKIHDSLGKSLFGISSEDLCEETGKLGFSSPIPVYRGIQNVMWCIEKS